MAQQERLDEGAATGERVRLLGVGVRRLLRNARASPRRRLRPVEVVDALLQLAARNADEVRRWARGR